MRKAISAGIACAMMSVPGARPETLYSVTPIVVAGFGENAAAYGINNSGQVTGASPAGAFLYSNGAITDLGTLPGAQAVGGMESTMRDRLWVSPASRAAVNMHSSIATAS